MILRRFGLTLPTRRSASSLSASPSTPSHPRKPYLSTRGRLKPLRGVSVGTRLSAARLSRSSGDDKGKEGTDLRQTRGRRKPTFSRTIIQHPEQAQYSFEPVRLYPVQVALHIALNPPHMPLPVHLGTTHYQSTHAPVSTSDPFTKPHISESTMSAQLASMEPSTSGYREHLNVLDALPPHLTPLPSDESPSFRSESDFPADLARTLAEAGVRNRVTSEYDWARVLTHLGENSSIAVSDSRGEIDEAVASLQTLLSRLNTKGRCGRSRMIAVVGPEGEEEWVRMDSTQRKRRKKITKHKYKKRRKVSDFDQRVCSKQMLMRWV